MSGVVLPPLVSLALLVAPAASPPLDWRIGIEDTWSQLGGLLGPPQTATLLDRMAEVTAAQSAGGDVNLNGLAGGWGGMQPIAGAAIDFSQSDAIVRLLQSRRFSLLWNLRLNAPWASAGNADCTDRSSATNCAPDAAHEEDLEAYVRALVERYDGDGLADMGSETPDPADDLTRPVRFYLMPGEIEFAGATPAPVGGYGDAARNHFWSDSTPNLLRTHRIVYRAVHGADPSGATRLVGSGGVLWDLYADFPDSPEVEGPTVTARLAGANPHAASFRASFDRLRELLRSYGDDADGRECDAVGWHPHMGWREVEQAFALIRRYAGALPIVVDDMWTNLYPQDRADAPGNTLFTGGGAAIEGDFPNALVPSYGALRSGLALDAPGVRDWYRARTARQLVKAFAAVFGEGAERASFSGNADFGLDRLLGITGYLNLLGTAGEGFPRWPATHALRRLVAELHDFVRAEEILVSADPHTRVYRFDRPRGPLFIAWSETGAAPPGLDYHVATGEAVTLAMPGESVAASWVVPVGGATEPPSELLAAPGGELLLRLGYEPLLLTPRVDPCTPNAATLCLGAGRFRVTTSWRTGTAEHGVGQAVPLTVDSGFFWFFAPENLEVVVKVLDACGLNQRFWVFAGGMTDVAVDLVVTDTATGAQRTYRNPAGEPFPPLQDTDAFVTCP